MDGWNSSFLFSGFQGICFGCYTPVCPNIAMENVPGLKMYFLLKMGIFQPAMLVYQRVVLRSVDGALASVFGGLHVSFTSSFPVWGPPARWSRFQTPKNALKTKAATKKGKLQKRETGIKNLIFQFHPIRTFKG